MDFRDFGIYLALDPDKQFSPPAPTGTGRSVALAAGRLIVGAPDERTWGAVWRSPPQPQPGSGAARVCHAVSTGWAEANYLVAFDAEYDANFGEAVTVVDKLLAPAVDGRPRGASTRRHFDVRFRPGSAPFEPETDVSETRREDTSSLIVGRA